MNAHSTTPSSSTRGPTLRSRSRLSPAPTSSSVTVKPTVARRVIGPA